MYDYTALITDRTRADVDSGAKKGGYDYTDLNRVTGAMEDIHNRLTEYGYATGYCPVMVAHQDGTSSTVWQEDDEDIRADRIGEYFANVAALRAVLTMPPSTPSTPADMDGLTHQEANDIEKILLDVDALISNMEQAWHYSGDLYAGEV